MPEPNLPQPLSDAVCRAHAGVLAAIQDSGSNIRERNSIIKDAVVKLETETLQSVIEKMEAMPDPHTKGPRNQLLHNTFEQTRRAIIMALKAQTP